MSETNKSMFSGVKSLLREALLCKQAEPKPPVDAGFFFAATEPPVPVTPPPQEAAPWIILYDIGVVLIAFGVTLFLFYVVEIVWRFCHVNPNQNEINSPMVTPMTTPKPSQTELVTQITQNTSGGSIPPRTKLMNEPRNCVYHQIIQAQKQKELKARKHNTKTGSKHSSSANRSVSDGELLLHRTQSSEIKSTTSPKPTEDELNEDELDEVQMIMKKSASDKKIKQKPRGMTAEIPTDKKTEGSVEDGKQTALNPGVKTSKVKAPAPSQFVSDQKSDKTSTSRSVMAYSSDAQQPIIEPPKKKKSKSNAAKEIQQSSASSSNNFMAAKSQSQIVVPVHKKEEKRKKSKSRTKTNTPSNQKKRRHAEKGRRTPQKGSRSKVSKNSRHKAGRDLSIEDIREIDRLFKMPLENAGKVERKLPCVDDVSYESFTEEDQATLMWEPMDDLAIARNAPVTPGPLNSSPKPFDDQEDPIASLMDMIKDFEDFLKPIQDAQKQVPEPDKSSIVPHTPMSTDQQQTGTVSMSTETNDSNICIEESIVELWPGGTAEINGSINCQTYRQVTFVYKDMDAAAVILTGSFFGWKMKLPLTRTISGFSLSISLPAGQHFYRMIVEKGLQ